MAKYFYQYACGHGQGIARLVGKQAERERHLRWHEQNRTCKDCFLTAKKLEDANTPQQAIVQVLMAREPMLQIVVRGQIETHKTALLELGFRWQGDAGGALRIYSMTAPKLVLAVLSKPLTNIDKGAQFLQHWAVPLNQLGYAMQNGLSDLDDAALRHRFEVLRKDADAAKKIAQDKASADEQAAAEHIALTAKAQKLDPELAAPRWYREIKAVKKFWNHKFYAVNDETCAIYLDGSKQVMQITHKNQYEAWLRDKKERAEFWGLKTKIPQQRGA